MWGSHNWSQFLNICQVSFVLGLNLAGLHNQMMEISRDITHEINHWKEVGQTRRELEYHDSEQAHEINDADTI